MAKVITFSRRFPSYHPRKGEPTYFVEQVLNHFAVKYHSDEYLQNLLMYNTVNLMKGKLSYSDIVKFHKSLQLNDGIKIHTIRSGNRFAEGEHFSPRVWSGVPYNSPQIIFYQDSEVKKSHHFAILSKEDNDKQPEGLTGIFINNKQIHHSLINTVAENDGLYESDFLKWFNYPSSFYGQIICWSNSINY